MKKAVTLSPFEKVLRSSGFKATPGRIKVLEILDKSSKPLSVNEVLKKFKGKKLDQATLYRMMEALSQKGVIRQIDFQHGHAHYELAGRHHHHLICEVCSKVVDISNCDVRDLEKQALKLSGFAKIKNHSLELFGICEECTKQDI